MTKLSRLCLRHVRMTASDVLLWPMYMIERVSLAPIELVAQVNKQDGSVVISITFKKFILVLQLGTKKRLDYKIGFVSQKIILDISISVFSI